MAKNKLWERNFSSGILKKGNDLYRRGLAEIVERDGDFASVEISGADPASVELFLNETGDPISVYCDCDYYNSGHICKHIAAALYEWDTPHRKSKAAVSKVNTYAKKLPFTSNKESIHDYRYFDLNKITADCKMKQADIDAAEKLIETGKIKDVRIGIGYGSEMGFRVEGQILTGTGMVMLNEKSYGPVTVFVSSGSVIYASCNVGNCWTEIDIRYSWSGYNRNPELCSHVIAMLLLMDEYIEAENPGDITDRYAFGLIKRYGNGRPRLRKRELTQESKSNDASSVVKIEPRLEINQQGMMASTFKVGIEKLYVIKDLSEFVETASGRKTMKLGKSTEIDFSECWFQENSLKVFEYIKNITLEEKLRRNMSYNDGAVGGGDNIKNTIMLYGQKMDDYFEMFTGTEVPYVDKSCMDKDTGNAELCDCEPDLQLKVSNIVKDGRFQGIELYSDVPECVSGTEHIYWFEDKKLKRGSRTGYDALKDLSPYVSCTRVDVRIGTKMLSEFYHGILNDISDLVEVSFENLEELEKHIYPLPAFRFYLDAPEKIITCKVEVTYAGNAFNILDGNRIVKGVRYFDAGAEGEVRQLLQEYFEGVEEDMFVCAGDENSVYDILVSGVDELMEVGEVHATDRFDKLTIHKKLPVNVGVRIESNLLNLEVTSEGITEEELAEIIASYRKKKKYHRLKNGDFIRLDTQSVEELSEILETTQVSLKDFVKGKMNIPAYRALYLDKMLEKNDALYANRDSEFKNLVRNFKTVADSDYELPETLKKTARGYQEYGYKWLRTVEGYKFGGILADEMGLGKTMQVISVLQAAVDEGKPYRTLVVTPASLVYNWIEEFSKFAPDIKAVPVAGTKADRTEIIENSDDCNVLVTSYDLLKRDISEYENIQFDYQVIDEAQFIKNPTTAAAKAVKAVNSKIRFALTGTPIENRLSELWSIFDYLMPGFLNSYDKFRKEFENPIAKNKDERAMARLKKMVEPFILRRLKADVLKELPEKIEEVCYVGFDENQQKLYDGQVVKMKKMLESQDEESFRENRFQILAEITRTRQICCDPGLCLEKYEGESAKTEACLELIENAMDGGHRMLVFSQFTSMLEILEENLNRKEIEYYKITGQTKKEERIALVKAFNEGSTPVFLISLKAGGTGLNLTGADIVLHFDPWWNIAAQNQATDRAHRIGQEKNVTVYKLIAKNTIEEKILHLQEAKSALADEILGGQTGSLMTMSRDDLLGLLE